MTRTAVLTDEMWALIEPELPPVKGAMGRPMVGHRRLVEGAIYRYRTGVAWRDLPAEFGPWQTVWKRHHRFSLDGTWDNVLAALQSQAETRGIAAGWVDILTCPLDWLPGRVWFGGSSREALPRASFLSR